MNQILYVEKNKGKKVKSSLSKKKYFIFIIILFIYGLFIISEGTYAFIRNMDYMNKLENARPTISIQQSGQKVIISVKHVREIVSIKYNWNNEENVTIQGNNRTNIIEEIELPRGNNSLNIIVQDSSKKQFVERKDFSIDIGNDIGKPKISLSVVGNNVKITATDDTEISYVTYRWNDETEEILHPSGSDLAKLEANIEIRKGQNKLTVIAVDASNNTQREEQSFIGSVKPTVELYVDGSDLLIIAKHETGIERIEFTLNGEKHIVNHYQLEPEMQHREPMVPGTNKISVQAYNRDGISGSIEGETVYTP